MKNFKTLVITLVFLPILSFSQKILTSTNIESWPANGVISVPEEYNRVSTYMYIINKKDYLNLFKGTKFTRAERKELDMKRMDKPSILQMSIEIDNKTISDSKLTIPILMIDLQNSEGQQTFEKGDGKILSDVNIKEISSDIMGSINVKALVKNNSVKFWKEVAKITADIGQAATSMAMGNPGGATELTNKLTAHLNQGIKELNSLNDGTKSINCKFMITLVDLQASSEFDEIVTSARLYQVHWTGKKALPNQGYFRNIAKDSKPNSFKDNIKGNDSLPLVLIIETRGKTKINIGEPTFNDGYVASIKNEYDLYPPTEWQMFKNYNTNFNIALSANNYLEAFNNTMTTSQPDWNSLINAIENIYLFRQNVQKETQKYSSNEYTDKFRERYDIIKNRYEKIDKLFVNMFQSSKKNVYLQDTETILKSLMYPITAEKTTE